jgi:hypothetical protein
MAQATIDEHLAQLQHYTIEFLSALHSYLQRAEEKKTLYSETRHAALLLGVPLSKLPPELTVDLPATPPTAPKRRGRPWSPETRKKIMATRKRRREEAAT